jgi:hypothetical protein
MHPELPRLSTGPKRAAAHGRPERSNVVGGPNTPAENFCSASLSDMRVRPSIWSGQPRAVPSSSRAPLDETVVWITGIIHGEHLETPPALAS